MHSVHFSHLPCFIIPISTLPEALVLGAPVQCRSTSPVLGAPVLGAPVLGATVLGAPVLGAQVLVSSSTGASSTSAR